VDRAEAQAILNDKAANVQRQAASGDLWLLRWATESMAQACEDPKILAAFGKRINRDDIMRPRLEDIK